MRRKCFMPLANGKVMLITLIQSSLNFLLVFFILETKQYSEDKKNEREVDGLHKDSLKWTKILYLVLIRKLLNKKKSTVLFSLGLLS